eukprot:388281_1
MLMYIGKQYQAIIGGTLHVDNVKHLQINCDYHSMCNNMNIYVKHTGNSSDNITIPDSICIACSTDSDKACESLTVHVEDAVNDISHTFRSVRHTATEPYYFYWHSSDDQVQIPIARAMENGTCA